MLKNEETKIVIENEVWKPVNEFQNYEISNFGRVKNRKTGRVFTGANDAYGYVHVRLVKDGKFHLRKIHRLVAEAFIPTTSTDLVVDHIDGDKKNNKAENLRWVTYSENARYYVKSVTESGKKKFGFAPRRNVAQYSLSGDLLAQFPGVKAAEKATGVKYFSVFTAASGKLKTAGGFMWRFFGRDSEPEQHIDAIPDRRAKSVVKVSPDGKKEYFGTAAEAARYMKKNFPARATGKESSVTTAIRCCLKNRIKTVYGFSWEYADEEA